MSRKMTKSILSRDEITLFKHSEELKNTDLYGNLYDILYKINKMKAISIDELIDLGLDDKGIIILTQNKKRLSDNIKREWYVRNNSAEDPNKRVRCGLCNAPNRYLFYIINRFNSTQLNVGSTCMTKFPEIEGYASHKHQLAQIQKTQRETERWQIFNDKFPNIEDTIQSTDTYFNNLPILLPYDIYYPFRDKVIQLRKMYNDYIKHGTKDMDGLFGSIERLLNGCKVLKSKAEKFIKNNINDKFVCKRSEIEWILNNKDIDFLYEISKNNGRYTPESIGEVYSINFIIVNFSIFCDCLLSKHIKIIMPENEHSSLNFINQNRNQILYNVNIKKFMKQIGSKCYFDTNFKFDEDELYQVSKIVVSNKNLERVIYSVEEKLERMRYVLLDAEDTQDLYLYNKNNKDIKKFSYSAFLQLYDLKIIRKHKDNSTFIGYMITYKKWISYEEQKQIGVDEKINRLYYHQCIEPYQ